VEAKVKTAVLLDIDGTLLDTNHLHVQAWQRALAQFGIFVDYNAIFRQIGKSGDQLIPVFVPKDDRERIQGPLERWRKDLFKREFFPHVKPFPKVRELVERIYEEGFEIALASSASEEELDFYKEVAQIEDLIEDSSHRDRVDPSRSHPDIFAVALERLGVPADQVIAVGDTPYDSEAAKRLEIASIGLTCGGWSEAKLIEAGFTEVYKDAAELLTRFNQSLFGITRAA
jgi:HAD superfamily hydrolase (TIGR01549 family)